MTSKKERKLLDRLKDKYRLIIYNDDTFQEVGFIKLTPLNLLALTGSLFVLFIVLFYVVVAYTSIREFIPGYPDANMRRAAWLNSQLLDSLEYQIDLRDKKLKIVSDIISGNTPEDSAFQEVKISKTAQVSFEKSLRDSLFRQQIEEEERFNVSAVTVQEELPGFSRNTFFAPVRGLISNSFKPSENHFGTDIVSQPNEGVKAVMEGTVILSTWTLETGNIIAIQHSFNLISVYKHNAELLKTTGNYVKAGEVIAIVGNSGELTSGPHLHFELWHNGTPLNPEDYIVF